MKIVTAHQSSYLPWLGFFHKILISDVFVLLDNVQFEKNSFSNRNKIKGPNGDFWLTVPVNLKNHLSFNIKDISISSDSKWQKKHIKAIEGSYSKSKYFTEYIDFFRDCYAKDWRNLSELNEYMMFWLLKQLGSNCEVVKMSDFTFESKKSELVLDISKKFNADMYVFGALGSDYADVDLFERNNIKLYFQKYEHPQYSQLYGNFIPYLSIIDLLFNCGDDATHILMKGNISRAELCEQFKV